jgi:hypothetical protein
MNAVHLRKIKIAYRILPSNFLGEETYLIPAVSKTKK